MPASKKETLLSDIHYSKDQDDLLDVHVGNPLHKIVELLQDIKKQKAFSFTLKGSLGIAGVALVLGVFGVFGGGKILCDKGTQTEIGTVSVLNTVDTDPSTIPILGSFIDYFQQTSAHNRVILVKQDKTTIKIPYSSRIKMDQYNNLQIAATGDYDSCSEELTITDPMGIETYLK